MILCAGKREFPTRREATMAVRGITARRNRHGAKKSKDRAMAPYRCPACRSWHLGRATEQHR